MSTTKTILLLLRVLLIVVSTMDIGWAFVVPSIVTTTSATTTTNLPSLISPASTTTSTSLSMGLLDDLQLIFSEEGKKNRAAYDAKRRAEQEEAQREILERRRNPDKMKEYEQRVATKRSQLQDDRSVWDFQSKVQDGYDPLTEWKRLREEGKITVGSDLERDPTSSRLGSEGLVDVRVDERLPYIDQGYVDDSSSDLMGGFMKLFGGGGNNKDGDSGKKE